MGWACLKKRRRGYNIKHVVMRNTEGIRPRGRLRQKWWKQMKGDIEQIGETEKDAEDKERWLCWCGQISPQMRGPKIKGLPK